MNGVRCGMDGARGGKPGGNSPEYVPRTYAYLMGVDEVISVKHQKATIRVTCEGCLDCGTSFSRTWHLVREVQVAIGKRRVSVGIHRCGECQAKQDAKAIERKVPEPMSADPS